MAEHEDSVNKGGHILSPNCKVLKFEADLLVVGTSPIQIIPPLHPKQEACDNSKSEQTLCTDAGTSQMLGCFVIARKGLVTPTPSVPFKLSTLLLHFYYLFNP